MTVLQLLKAFENLMLQPSKSSKHLIFKTCNNSERNTGVRFKICLTHNGLHFGRSQHYDQAAGEITKPGKLFRGSTMPP